MGSAGILPAAVGMLPAALVARLARFLDLIVVEAVRQDAALALHDALTQKLVLSGEQILHEIVTALIGVG